MLFHRHLRWRAVLGSIAGRHRSERQRAPSSFPVAGRPRCHGRWSALLDQRPQAEVRQLFHSGNAGFECNVAVGVACRLCCVSLQGVEDPVADSGLATEGLEMVPKSMVRAHTIGDQITRVSTQ